MIAYIILAHKNINQLKRLINQINNKKAYIIVHIDKKVSFREFDKIRNYYNNDNIFFMNKRYNCVWGDYSIVKATNSCIKYLLDLNIDFTHSILLSGMDFPIKANKEIIEFLNNNRNINFIECSLNGKYKDESKYNIRYFKYSHLFMNAKIHNLVFRAQYKLSYILRIKRNHPIFNKVYFGSQWWVLTKETLININKFMKANKNYIKFYKNTNIPDEYFYHTIVGNLYPDTIRNYNLHFIEWGKDQWHPNTLTIKDKTKLDSSYKLFARKFDIYLDEDIILYLENNLNIE